MTVKQQKIVLKGQVYATPRTESVVVKNQGVLCSSGGGKGGIQVGIQGGKLG